MFQIFRILLMGMTLTLAGMAQSQTDDRALYQKVLVLAQTGHPEAQYHMGMFLNNGIGTTRDPKQALTWFEAAAGAGHGLAAYKVGCYLAGQWGPIVPLDPDKALAFKLEAAKQGYMLAQHEVGNLYMQRGMPIDARQWWLAAARQGYATSLYNLSVSYLQSQEEAPDPVRGYAYFMLSKLLSDRHINAQAQTALDRIRESMTFEQLNQAEHIVADWRVQPTALTLEASQGLQRAKGLVQ